jgi:hypothetical protein
VFSHSSFLFSSWLMALWFLFYFFSLLSHPSVESLYLTTPLAVGFLIHQVFHRLARNKCLCFFTVRSESLLSSLKRVVYHKMVPMTRTKMHHDNVIRRFLYTLTIKYRFHIHICEQQVTTSEPNLASFPWLYKLLLRRLWFFFSINQALRGFLCLLAGLRALDTPRVRSIVRRCKATR